MATKSAALVTPPSGPPPSNPQSSPNLVQFDPKLCVPQQPVYLQRNDALFFVGITNAIGITIECNYRFLTPEGEIKEGQFITTSVAGVFNFFLNLYEGWLLSFSIWESGTPITGAWSYIQVEICRSTASGASVPIQGVLWQGYLHWNTPNGWPGTPSKEITDGPGMLRYVAGSTPAAGAEISEGVPAQRRWSLLSIQAVLTTSATVANRNPAFIIYDAASNILHLTPSYLNQAASLLYRYFLGVQPTLTIPLTPTISLHCQLPFQLKNNCLIKTQTANLQASDQWSAPVYTFLEWGNWDT